MGSLSSSLQVLQLDDNALTGSFPDAFLSQDSKIVHLSLSENDFTGSLPTHLSSWTLLKILDLHGNRFDGQIPSNLPSSLVTLYLNRNLLTGELPNTFASMSNLRSVMLDTNQLSGTLHDKFYVTGNNFDEFTNLTNVMELSFYGNNFSDINDEMTVADVTALSRDVFLFLYHTQDIIVCGIGRYLKITYVLILSSPSLHKQTQNVNSFVQVRSSLLSSTLGIPVVDTRMLSVSTRHVQKHFQTSRCQLYAVCRLRLHDRSGFRVLRSMCVSE